MEGRKRLYRHEKFSGQISLSVRPGAGRGGGGEGGKGGYLSLSACKLADAPSKVNDIVIQGDAAAVVNPSSSVA